MTTQATLERDRIVALDILYMVMELSNREWKVAFASPAGRRLHRSVKARDVPALLGEIAAAKKRLKLPADARVLSIYEAGRDGFWIDRVLRLHGIDSMVVDSASIEVPRRARRAKTDRLDLASLMALLVRWIGGELKALRIVPVPDVETEDLRQLSRAIERLKGERGQHTARIGSLLIKEGLEPKAIGGSTWARRVSELRMFDGKPLGRWLCHDLVLEGERLALVVEQLLHLQKQRDALVQAGQTPVAAKARQLMRLGAIGRESSFVFATEVLGWRTFANRCQLAGAVGLVPTPFRSGAMAREQGISKAGNRRMRTMMVEIAWCWLRYQPTSELALWWRRRFDKTNARLRKIGIVALARKLLVALWRFLEEGIVPAGAELKGTRRRERAA